MVFPKSGKRKRAALGTAQTVMGGRRYSRGPEERSGRCGFGGQGTDSQSGVTKILARARVVSRASRDSRLGHAVRPREGRPSRTGRDGRGSIRAPAPLFATPRQGAVPRSCFSRRPAGNPCPGRNNRNVRASPPSPPSLRCGETTISTTKPSPCRTPFVEVRQNDGMPRRTVHLPHLTSRRSEPGAENEAAPDVPERSSAKRTSRRNDGGGHRSCEDVGYSSSKAPV